MRSKYETEVYKSTRTDIKKEPKVKCEYCEPPRMKYVHDMVPTKYRGKRICKMCWAEGIRIPYGNYIEK